MKRSVQTLPEKYQVCAVAFSDAGDQVCSDRLVHSWQALHISLVVYSG